MVELREPMPLRVRRWLIAVLLVLLAVLFVRLMQRRNDAIASAGCSALYRAARTAADTARADRARPDVGGRDAAGVLACGQLRATRRPTFSDYLVDTTFTGPVAALNFDHDSSARRFRTVLHAGIAGGPNFAGHFAIVTWGCGTNCQSYAIVDLASGMVRAESPLDFSCHGVDYRRSSRLVVMAPADIAPGQVCSSRDTIRLLWSGTRFDPLPPDCSGPDQWPASMAFVYLKNAHLADNSTLDQSRTKVVRLTSEQVDADRFRQVHDITFAKRSGKTIEVLTVSDASYTECSMGNVDVFLAVKLPGGPD